MPSFREMRLHTTPEGAPTGTRYEFALTWRDRLAVLLGARMRLQSTFRPGEPWPRHNPVVTFER
jgi:hypothetical protein